jgi:hypothetical protein
MTSRPLSLPDDLVRAALDGRLSGIHLPKSNPWVFVAAVTTQRISP